MTLLLLAAFRETQDATCTHVVLIHEWATENIVLGLNLAPLLKISQNILFPSKILRCNHDMVEFCEMLGLEDGKNQIGCEQITSENHSENLV